VYTQIYNDLTAANSRLLTSGTNLPFFANKAAAQLLFSRVALYNKDYTNAKKWADSVIISQGTKLLDSTGFVAGWRRGTHPESLFELRFANNAENIGVNLSLQTTFTTLIEVGDRSRTAGFGDLVPTNTLLADLGIVVVNQGSTGAPGTATTLRITSRTRDFRNLLFEEGTTGRGGAFVECTKYIGKNGFPNLDNVPILRIAEAYLNRAEALSTPGSPILDEASARADLIRLKQSRIGDYPASNSAFDNALTGVALYNEVLKQRRLEFAFEGHRFFDIKRLGRDLIKGPHYLDVSFTDIRILPAIPQREIDGNRNIVQNQGY
jgi:starch-binding outer membrane protein, SusD/RagB family